MELHVWLAFASASIALLLIPGPTVLLILSYAISQGRRVALATVAGGALGHVDKWRNQRRIDVMSMKPRKLSAVLS